MRSLRSYEDAALWARYFQPTRLRDVGFRALLNGKWRRAVGVGESLASTESAFAQWRGYAVTYPTKYKRLRATLWRPALRRLQATYNSDEDLARGHTIPRSPLAQRTRAVPELLRMRWVVSGDPKAITRDVRRYLSAFPVSNGGHHGRARIASDDRGGAGEGSGIPLHFWRRSGGRTETLVAEGVGQLTLC